MVTLEGFDESFQGNDAICSIHNPLISMAQDGQQEAVRIPVVLLGSCAFISDGYIAISFFVNNVLMYTLNANIYVSHNRRKYTSK